IPHFEELAQRYIKHLNSKVFERRAPKDLRLYYIGFPEALARSGYPTPFHYHLFVKVPDGYERQFHKYKNSEWRKVLRKKNGLCNIDDPDVKRIYNLPKLVRYATKYSHWD